MTYDQLINCRNQLIEHLNELEQEAENRDHFSPREWDNNGLIGY